MQNAYYDNVLRCGIGALIVFATMMLGVGEESIVLTLVALVVVCASIYLTDLTNKFQIGRQLANWVAVGVVGLSAVHASQVDRAGQVLAVANLQSYLQFVLLFQPKTPRVYWQLALLSLGQVAIASTLVAGPLFGMMLLVYVVLGVGTFTLLLLQAESARFTARPLLAGAAPVWARCCRAAVRRCWLARLRRRRAAWARLERTARGRRRRFGRGGRAVVLLYSALGRGQP